MAKQSVSADLKGAGHTVKDSEEEQGASFPPCAAHGTAGRSGEGLMGAL